MAFSWNPLMPADELAELRASKRYNLGALDDLNTLQSKLTHQAARAQKPDVSRAINRLHQIKQQADKAYDQLSELSSRRGEEYRAFKFDLGLMRDARTPDRFKTFLKASVAVLVEGAMVASLMVGDGKMETIPGVAYGLTSATLNVGAGMFSGYFFGRYLDYRKRAKNPDPDDWKVRLRAKLGLGVFVGLMGLLSFGAARTRATGDHTGIFDFSEIGLLATFDDYYALAIVVLSIIGALLGYHEGKNGIDDPVPEFSESRRAAEDEVWDEAETLRERLLTQADDVYASACDLLEDARESGLDDADAYETLRTDLVASIPEHNDEVTAAKEVLQAQAEQRGKRVGYISQGRQPIPRADLKSLDALILKQSLIPPPLQPANDNDLSDASAHLKVAYEDCISAIEELHAAFLIAVPDTDFPLE